MKIVFLVYRDADLENTTPKSVREKIVPNFDSNLFDLVLNNETSLVNNLI